MVHFQIYIMKSKEAKVTHQKRPKLPIKEAKVANFIFLGPLLAHYLYFGLCGII
jgi:hypothetical protein